MNVRDIKYRNKLHSLGLVSLRLPKLQLVAVGIHYPCEFAVKLLVRSFDDLDAVLFEMCEKPVQIVDSIVDHKARLTWCKPLAIRSSCRPDGHTAIQLS